MRFNKRWFLVAGLFVLALVMAGCGGTSGVRPGIQPPGTYTVSGVIQDGDGDPVSGVVLTFSGTTDTTESDLDGGWVSPHLTGEVTVTPADPAYTFTRPSSRTVTEEADDIDFTGSLKPCNSGRASDPHNPCVMTQTKQLLRMQHDLNGHYALGGDIYAFVSELLDGGEGFEPIGTSTAPFNGTFDGNNHVIHGLFIQRPTTDRIGLFGVIGANAEIRDLKLEFVNVVGRSYVGGLVGENAGGQISGSYATGFVGAADFVGGLVGHNIGGTITDSGAAGMVETEANGGRVGGLIGVSKGGVIEKAYVDSSVRTDGSYAGGLIGQSTGDDIELAYSLGSVQGDQDVGGLVGRLINGNVARSYSHAWVLGNKGVGGLVGLVLTEAGGMSLIGVTYSVGAVGSGETGGLIGARLDGGITVVTNSFWDQQSSRQNTSAGIGAVGKTTTEMQKEDTYPDSWVFPSDWRLRTGEYPDLNENPRARALQLPKPGIV